MERAQKPALVQQFIRKVFYNPEYRGSVHDFGENNWKQFVKSIFGSTDTDSGQTVSPEIGTGINTIFNCLNVLGQDIATQTKQFRQDSAKGKQVLHGGLHYLLNHQPNGWENAWHFWYGTVFIGEGWGNSYAYISQRDAKGYATELIRLKPWAVEPKLIEGELFYVVNNKVAIPSRDMFHYRSMVLDGPKGIDKITYNAKTVGLKIKQQKFTAKSLGNKPPGMLVMRDSTPEQRKEAKEVWNNSVSGENIAGTPVLYGDLDYKQLMLNPEAAEIVLQHQLSDQYLMGIWRMQPAMLSMHEKSNYNVVEQQNINHVKYALMPIITNLEQEMHKLFPESNKTAEYPQYIKFNVKSLLRGDTATQTAFYNFLTVNGHANSDEIRELEDWSPQPDGLGKDYYIQGAMVKKTKDAPELTDKRTMELLDQFAKKHKLNGYANQPA